MWVSRQVWEEMQATRALADSLSHELAAERLVRQGEAATHRRAIERLESIVTDQRQQLAVKQNSFDWLAASHERLERWFAELLHSKSNITVPVSTIGREYVPAMPPLPHERPAGEGVRERDDDGPGDIESLYRKNSGALFEDVGDALATREGIAGDVYAGIEPITSEG